MANEYRPVGTATMGQATDERLRVLGTKGLRVIDASVDAIACLCKHCGNSICNRREGKWPYQGRFKVGIYRKYVICGECTHLLRALV